MLAVYEVSIKLGSEFIFTKFNRFLEEINFSIPVGSSRS